MSCPCLGPCHAISCHDPGLLGPARPILWVMTGQACPVNMVNVLCCRPIVWVFCVGGPTQFNVIRNTWTTLYGVSIENDYVILKCCIQIVLIARE